MGGRRVRSGGPPIADGPTTTRHTRRRHDARHASGLRGTEGPRAGALRAKPPAAPPPEAGTEGGAIDRQATLRQA